MSAPKHTGKGKGKSKAGDRIVLERYRITRRLGVGGMGTVYEAEHIHLGSRHAIKALRTIGDQPQATRKQLEMRFLREAKICAAIRHPNLVPVTDFGAMDGVPYIVMDYIDGHDLQVIISKQGPMELRRALGVLRQVAGAVGALHDKGIIHRDLKPPNVMVERETGRVVLTDLGIAKDLAAGVQVTQDIIGTPAYMSPEQMVDTSKTTSQSDIYSLGAMFYAIVTGKDPFKGESALAVLQKARESLFAYGSLAGVARRRDKREFPPAVSSLLHDMTLYDRKKRLGSTKQVVERIDAILSKGPPPEAGAMSGGEAPKSATDARAMAAPPRRESDPHIVLPSDSPPARARRSTHGRQTSTVLAALTSTGIQSEQERPKRSGAGAAIVVVLLLAGAGIGAYLWVDPHGLLGAKKETAGGEAGPGTTALASTALASTALASTALASTPKNGNGAEMTPVLAPDELRDAQGAPARLEIPLPGTRALELVLVRPGRFQIGSKWKENERPSKDVELTRLFYVGRFEVTVGQFASYLNARQPGAPKTAEPEAMGLDFDGATYRPAPGETDHPIRAITHIQARAFCKWVARQSRLRVDLPGEVEWEYAARGPEARLYPWGNRWEAGRCRANEQSPADVGSYPTGRSWCGAEDMAGNVFEWCADRYVKGRYRRLPVRDPPVEGAGSSDDYRVIRGGGYKNDQGLCRPAWRNGWTGTESDGSLGFRVKALATEAVLKFKVQGAKRK